MTCHPQTLLQGCVDVGVTLAHWLLQFTWNLDIWVWFQPLGENLKQEKQSGFMSFYCYFISLEYNSSNWTWYKQKMFFKFYFKTQTVLADQVSFFFLRANFTVPLMDGEILVFLAEQSFCFSSRFWIPLLQ